MGSDEISQMAREYEIDLTKVKGSGPNGEVTLKDLQKYIDENYLPKPLNVKPLPSVRRIIAERLHKSWAETIPVTINMEAEVDSLVECKSRLDKELASEVPLTVLLIKCLAKALRENIEINSRLDGDKVIIFDNININVAVDTSFGLVTPVIRDVDKKTLGSLLKQYRDVVDRARKGLLKMKDFIGGTFTITNLGMFGVDSFTPIINPPQVAILGVNKIKEVLKLNNSNLREVKVMILSLTFDHRVIDGAPAARFLQRVKYYIENPSHLMVQPVE